MRNTSEVLRIKEGEQFTVCDGNGTDYVCQLLEMSVDGAEAKVLDKTARVWRAHGFLRRFCGFFKGDRLETVIQKCVEIGASEIALFRHSGASQSRKALR
jgi:16S rRNA (uracil1498-N3)-methyltransferase